jgi:hypothetical protein
VTRTGIGGHSSVARTWSSSSAGTSSPSRKNVSAKGSQSPACASASSRARASFPMVRGEGGS